MKAKRHLFGKARYWLLSFVLFLVWGFAPLNASAHPLGNFTVNQYSRLEVGASGIKVMYVLDMAEIPTVQERQLIDQNNDKQLSKEEQTVYAAAKAKEIKEGLKLTIDDKPIELKLASQEMTFLEGQGGLTTLRLTLLLETATLSKEANRLAYSDKNFLDRIGWKEIIIRPADGVALQNSTVPQVDQSNGLRQYPTDMISSPLNLTNAQATFKVDPNVQVNNGTTSEQSSQAANNPLSFFNSIFNGQALTLPVVLLSFLVAFGLGMLHSFSPGHGKTVVGAYLVGSRSTASHAVFLGITVTITHTIGVFALGFLTLAASQFIVPDKFYPWLSLISGVMVLFLGLNLLRSRIQVALRPANSNSLVQPDYHQPKHDHHDHQHDHAHTHEQGELPHAHGGKPHSHLPPGADGSKVTWKNLLVFGISAGILPCPSALILMLSAIALNLTTFGLVLVVFFSLGLAATLTIIGLLLIYARKVIAKFQLGVPSVFIRFIPVFAALAVTIVGVILAYEAVIQLQTNSFSR